MTVDDFDTAAAFYRQLLGVELAAQWDQPRGEGGIFELPHATPEVLDAWRPRGGRASHGAVG